MWNSSTCEIYLLTSVQVAKYNQHILQKNMGMKELYLSHILGNLLHLRKGK